MTMIIKRKKTETGSSSRKTRNEKGQRQVAGAAERRVGERTDMGAWGVKAYDNDTAADWVFDKITKAIERALNSRSSEPEEVLAALAVAVDLGLVPWLDWESVENALALVKRNDEKTKWKTPEERAAYLKAFRARLRRGRKASGWTPLTAVLKKTKTKTKPRRTSKAVIKKKVSA